VSTARKLDALNFVLADVRDGLGPYLAIYLLTVHHWDQASIGYVMSIGGIAGVLAQTPAGAFVDATRAKRAIIVVAAVVVTLGSIALAVVPGIGKQPVVRVRNFFGILTVGHCADLVRARDNVLGQQKPGGQFSIIARSAHHHGEWAPVQANLERLLDGRAVRVLGPDRSMDADDVDRPHRLGHGAHVTLNRRRTDGQKEAFCRRRGARTVF